MAGIKLALCNAEKSQIATFMVHRDAGTSGLALFNTVVCCLKFCLLFISSDSHLLVLVYCIHIKMKCVFSKEKFIVIQTYICHMYICQFPVLKKKVQICDFVA